jgi:effector-binding domain-containing protein
MVLTRLATAGSLPAGYHRRTEIKQLAQQHTATIRVEHVDDVGRVLGDVLPAIFGHLGALGIKPTYPPFARFHGGTAGDWDMEAGVGVPAPIADAGRIKASVLPAVRAAVTWHVGAYDQLPAAWMRLRDEAEAQGLPAAGGPWEVYWSNPAEVQDPNELRTELIYPIV